ncbi:MAG: EI24 domain-containing protein [Rhodospirillales bacterium]|nr:EI24 domain-containing protein [Rhodospirillales bacterium]
MIGALSKAFGDLHDPKLRRTLFAIALWSIGFYVALLMLMFGGLGAANLDDWANRQAEWMPGGLIEVGSFVLAFFVYLGLIWFTFIVVTQTVAAFYLDGVVRRVEELNYPHLPPAKGTTVTEDVISTIKFTAMLLLVNLVALPFYILGLFIPFVSIGIFYLVNGYLFGREYAEVVILRRLPADEATAWRKANRNRLWLTGAVIAFGMTIPLLNFLGPVVAAAFMTHVYRGGSQGRGVRGS